MKTANNITTAIKSLESNIRSAEQMRELAANNPALAYSTKMAILEDAREYIAEQKAEIKKLIEADETSGIFGALWFHYDTYTKEVAELMRLQYDVSFCEERETRINNLVEALEIIKSDIEKKRETK